MTKSMDEFNRQVLQIAGFGVWALVTGKPLKTPFEPIDDPRWNEKRGLFVTLRSQGKIRGSVGWLESGVALQEALFEVSGTAATHDARYKPVEESELKDLEVEVTLLSVFKTSKDLSEMEVGKTGLVVSRGDKRAVLLPQVSVERGWTMEQFLEACCEKAGLSHKAWKDDNTLVEIFSSEIFSERLMPLIEPFI